MSYIVSYDKMLKLASKYPVYVRQRDKLKTSEFLKLFSLELDELPCINKQLQNVGMITIQKGNKVFSVERG